MKILILVTLLHLHPQYTVMGKHRTVTVNIPPPASTVSTSSPVMFTPGNPVIFVAGKPVIFQ